MFINQLDSKMRAIIILLLIIPIILGGEKRMIPSFPPKPDNEWKVTLTTYTVSVDQTDSTPLQTASGFKLDSLNPRRHKVIAVSWDLKRKLKFGARVRVKRAGRFNGVYYVRDVMNKRFKNKIDILINPEDKHTKLKNVLLVKI